MQPIVPLEVGRLVALTPETALNMLMEGSDEESQTEGTDWKP